MNPFQTLSAELDQLTDASKAYFPLVLKIVAVVWAIQILNAFLGYRLNVLGIYPRHFFGLPGIVFSPFLHGNFSHLFMNTPPLIILMMLVLVEGNVQFYSVTAYIILVTGGLLWLFGRQAIHIGASGVVMGYWGYILMNAYNHWSLTTLILAGVCLYYFGSLYMNIFPIEKQASWEAHLFGLITGISASIVFPLPSS
ncbi:MAG TPA: rhomboid family intramembrane serine protease [Coxiellaceae bacterium]|nr:rhomboid family intramembrane serine protease [Coxiellaceae bacterium]